MVWIQEKRKVLSEIEQEMYQIVPYLVPLVDVDVAVTRQSVRQKLYVNR